MAVSKDEEARGEANDARRKERGKIEKEPMSEFIMINYKARESMSVCQLTIMMNDVHIVYSFLSRFKDNGISRHRIWKI